MLDLTQAYNQLTLDEEANKLVTIITHRGIYAYNKLPFGVASTHTVFQRMMESILQGIDGVACYIDDIIITGKTVDEHLDHVEQVLKRLFEHGVKAHKGTCHFLQASVPFLGHMIDSKGIHTTPDKLLLRPLLLKMSLSYVRFVSGLVKLLQQVHSAICNNSTLAECSTVQECKIVTDERMPSKF